MAKRDDDVREVYLEEGSRGKRRPVRGVTRERERIIREAARLLEAGSDREAYVSAIRALELTEESPEFRQFLKVWDDLHGR